MAKIVSLEKINELYKQYPENIVYTLKVYQALLDLDKVETYECNLPDAKMLLMITRDRHCLKSLNSALGQSWKKAVLHLQDVE